MNTVYIYIIILLHGYHPGRMVIKQGRCRGTGFAFLTYMHDVQSNSHVGSTHCGAVTGQMPVRIPGGSVCARAPYR